MLLAVWTRIVRNDRPVSTEALSRCTIASRLSAEEHLAYTQAKIANAKANRSPAGTKIYFYQHTLFPKCSLRTYRRDDHLYGCIMFRYHGEATWTDQSRNRLKLVTQNNTSP